MHDDLARLPIPLEARLQEARVLSLSALIHLKTNFQKMSAPEESDAIGSSTLPTTLAHGSAQLFDKHLRAHMEDDCAPWADKCDNSQRR